MDSLVLNNSYFCLLFSQSTGGELLWEPEPDLRGRRSDGHAVPADTALAHLVLITIVIVQVVMKRTADVTLASVVT